MQRKFSPYNYILRLPPLQALLHTQPGRELWVATSSCVVKTKEGKIVIYETHVHLCVGYGAYITLSTAFHKVKLIIGHSLKVMSSRVSVPLQLNWFPDLIF